MGLTIAVLAPSPTPFVVGGLERLAFELTEAVNRYTPHEADLIKVPVREDTLRALLTGYWRFSRLNLDHFDAVISMKYPTWMVRHRNHIVYMAHCLRGLYDTYPGPTRLREAWRRSPWEFPGYWARAIVQALDRRALDVDRIAEFSAISGVVAARRSYYPEMAAVEVVHPPSGLPRRAPRLGRHLLSVGRLDGPKRFDLVIEAYRRLPEEIRGDLPLIIVGRGPLREELARRGADLPGLSLRGRVSEEDLAELYAESAAVIYVPVAEDYGLVAAEAVAAGKPVVTCRDSGGVTEIVEEGVTGRIVEPAAEAVAAGVLDVLDPAFAERHRDAAAARAAALRWPAVIGKLLEHWNYTEDILFPEADDDVPLALVLSTYPLTPPVGGGRQRALGLARVLAERFRVIALGLVDFGTPPELNRLGPTLAELQIPHQARQAHGQAALERSLAGRAAGDLAALDWARTTHRLTRILDYYRDRLACVLVVQPYLYHLVAAWGGRADSPAILLDSQNVEADLKREQLAGLAAARKVLGRLARHEARAVTGADLVLCASAGDGARLEALYQLPADRWIHVPNAVAPPAEVDPERVASWRRRLALTGPAAIFVASWHDPNLEALTYIIEELAPRRPETTFLVAGSVGDQWERQGSGSPPPANVLLLGCLDEADLEALYALARVALNPVRLGSGTNVKMAEYMTRGVAVLTTPEGARGLGIEPGREASIAPREDWPAALEDLLRRDELRGRLAAEGRRFALARFTWSAAAAPLRAWLHERFDPPLPIDVMGLVEAGAVFVGEWHEPERWAGDEGAPELVRWTGRRATLRLPNPGVPSRFRAEILGGPRGGAVCLTALDRRDRIPVAPERWTPVEVELPVLPPHRRWLPIDIEAEVWSPAEEGLGPDPRRLGIALRRARLEAGEAAP